MNEQQFRRSLGIPDDAEHVLIFSESSHWDPNWILTSEEYFERFVHHNLDRAIEELKQEPRRIYSVENMFFLRMYWERYPGQRDNIRELVNERRLRLTNSSVTTADTLLPRVEAILRDFLIGQEWLRTNGMKQEPELAYFPDSFGCTPALPSILRAAGFNYTAITRIDGMYFMGCDLESSKRFPRQGSSAECLLNKQHSLDFIWRDRNGAEVLSHWNAFTYGQGDMLAFVGLNRTYLARFALPARSQRHIAYRVNQYVNQLLPYSRTPYMLCPIGFDFVEPIPDLIALLDQYNKRYYPTTGIWVLNAGIDDYLALVEYHSEKLPILELDPNPYWTGFYTSRPSLKRRCYKLTDHLLLLEKLSFLLENNKFFKEISQKLNDIWWQAVVSNHHDFITGTSSDRIVQEEQIPMLVKATESVDAAIEGVAAYLPASNDASIPVNLPAWSRKNGKIFIDTKHFSIELSENKGGAIVNLKSQKEQTSLLTGVSNDIINYRDLGGLWRMGYEFVGGIWKEADRVSQQRAQLDIHELNGGLEITSVVELKGQTLRRSMWVSNNLPLIHCRIEGRAAEGYTTAIRFKTGILAEHLVMDMPGGVAIRPLGHIYNPTFWPFHSFVHLQDVHTGRGIAVLQPIPGAVSYEPDGKLEIIALRNATREKVFGLIGIPCNPVSGHEYESCVFQYALLFTQNGDWKDNNVHILARDIAVNPWSNRRDELLHRLADSIATTSSDDVCITAVKPAYRGEGIIVRLYSPLLLKSPVQVKIKGVDVLKAFLCDARERDLKPLKVNNGTVYVDMQGTIATIRLLIN